MRLRTRGGRRGNTTIEFVLVGIPMIFILLSIFEIARGMWIYNTMAYAVREGVRYAIMHGKGCASPNSCSVTIGGIATRIRQAGVGLDPNSVTLTFTPAGGTASSGTMTTQMASSTTWPPSAFNAPGQQVKISAQYQFRTFLALFWAGAGQSAGSGSFNLVTASAEPIQF